MKKGRELELLIKKIQEFKIPDAMIKSPEYVIDVDTGIKREVDVSIRIKKGNIEKFIAIECRDRKSVQDIQWIEQLITKKESIQADTLIAVTSSDFTRPVQIKAQKRGIILRKLNSMTPEEIEFLLNDIIIEFEFVQPLIQKVDIEIPDIFDRDYESYNYSIKGINKRLNFDEIVSLWNTPNLIRSVCAKIDDFEKGKFVRFEFATPDSFIYHETKSYSIKNVRFIYEIHHKVIKLPLTSIMLYQGLEKNIDETIIYEYFDDKQKLSEIIHDIESSKFRWDIYAKDFIKEGMVLIRVRLKSDKPIELTMMKLDI